MRSTLLILILGLAFSWFVSAADTAPDYGVDAIFTAPVGSERSLTPASVRVGVTVDTIHSDLEIGGFVFLPVEVMGRMMVGSGEIELTRAQVSLLRATFARDVTAKVLTAYRNLDRGILYGADLIALRVPFSVTENGEIVIVPGLELGVRSFIDAPSKPILNASVTLDARAATRLVKDWLSTGILAHIQYDLNVSQAGGFSAKSQGYFSLLLNRERKMFVRAYAGGDYQPSLVNLGISPTSVSTGVGIFGNFE